MHMFSCCDPSISIHQAVQKPFHRFSHPGRHSVLRSAPSPSSQALHLIRDLRGKLLVTRANKYLPTMPNFCLWAVAHGYMEIQTNNPVLRFVPTLTFKHCWLYWLYDDRRGIQIDSDQKLEGQTHMGTRSIADVWRSASVTRGGWGPRPKAVLARTDLANPSRAFRCGELA